MAALEGIVESTLAGMGFELVDARASGGGRHLAIFIDRPGGITVDHCAEVSRQLARVSADGAWPPTYTTGPGDVGGPQSPYPLCPL